MRKAIIIGGGPAGLAAAIRLQQQTNVVCTVYELRPKPSTVGGAIGIQPNGVRLLARLGVYDNLVAKGYGNSTMTLRSPQKGVIGQQEMVGNAKAEIGYGYVRIRRSDLLDVMIQAAEKANVTIKYGMRLAGIQDGPDSVRVTFADGSTDTADMLLGCDGIHSQVRKTYVDPESQPSYTGIASVGCVVAASSITESASKQFQGIQVCMTQDGLIMVTPCTPSGDEIMLVFSKETPIPETGDTRDGWEARRREQIQSFKQSILGKIEGATGEYMDALREISNAVESVQFYPIFKLPPGGCWSRGRCLLLGDAGHAMSPHAGQGTSMALEDVFLVSRLLQDASRSWEDVKHKFDQVRRPRIDAIALQSLKNASTRKKTSAWGLWVKEFTMGAWFWLSWLWGPKVLAPSAEMWSYDIDQAQLEA